MKLDLPGATEYFKMYHNFYENRINVHRNVQLFHISFLKNHTFIKLLVIARLLIPFFHQQEMGCIPVRAPNVAV